MGTIGAAVSDIGTRKDRNQDAYGLRIASNGVCEAAFAVVCDGVGGMEHGEVASSTAVDAMLRWFDSVLPSLFTENLSARMLYRMWDSVLQEVNLRLFRQAEVCGSRMGTTLAAVLLLNGRCCAVSAGDTRIYGVNGAGTVQISRDHTLVQREVEQGRISVEQARRDARKNVLVRCVGGAPRLRPEYYTRPIEPDSGYLLCTDGFYRRLTERELRIAPGPGGFQTGEEGERVLLRLTGAAKSRGEPDNLTALLLWSDDAVGESDATIDPEARIKLLRADSSRLDGLVLAPCASGPVSSHFPGSGGVSSVLSALRKR